MLPERFTRKSAPGRSRSRSPPDHRDPECDWKTLVDLDAAAIVDGLQGPFARNVDPRLITPAFGEALRADGLDLEYPMTVRRAASPFYVFEQADREAEEFAAL